MKKPRLPDVSSWQPRTEAADTLQAGFQKRCTQIEESILVRSRHERSANIDEFDSGIGVEDIVRQELARLCPRRYSIRSGVINDSLGRTAGDFDVVVFNDLWFPVVKAGATENSRRFHYPVEGVYAAIEIKQTLTYKELDRAMEKLVAGHRLERPRTFANRLVENRDLDTCFHGLTNPLYSAIMATRLPPQVTFEDLVNRFFDVNKQLRRLEVIRCLCVLGEGCVTWGYYTEECELRPARFMRDDLFHPIVPILHRVPKIESSLYPFACDLLMHLYHSVLGAEDIAWIYGPDSPTISRPKSTEIALEPDLEWLSLLDLEYDEHGNRVPRPIIEGESASTLHVRMANEIKRRNQKSLEVEESERGCPNE